jgi:hypothetical protein
VSGRAGFFDSRPAPLPRNGPQTSRDACLRILLEAHRTLPPGPLLKDRYDEFQRGRRDAPSRPMLKQIAASTAEKPVDLVRAALALDGLDAWQEGRVQRPTHEELLRALARALPLLPDPSSPGFYSAYERLREGRRDLLSMTNLVKRARALGLSDYREFFTQATDRRKAA